MALRWNEGRCRHGGLLRLLGFLGLTIASLLTFRHSASPEKRRIAGSLPDYPRLRPDRTTLFGLLVAIPGTTPVVDLQSVYRAGGATAADR
jgi:hypothetical protein